jgi:spermidine/putrescine transport system substrate-binding protein
MVARRPGPDRARLTRRTLLRGAVTAGAVSPLLVACGDQLYTTGALQIAAPDNPVRWPIHHDVPMIESGLKPEPGSTLRLYNYADYLSPRVMKNFTKEFGVEISLSTFNDTDEALTKIAAGGLAHDIYFPSYDQIGRMVAARLVRPLNHDYLPNIANCWPQFQDPWYDLGWQYSVPYTTYTTGIGWNTDLVEDDIAALPNPYDALWNPDYRGMAAIIDDWHTAMAFPLLRHGIQDVNTGKASDLALLRHDLLDLSKTSEPKVTVQMYNDLPSGQIGISQMWSGDIVNAVYYLPKGKEPDILRYWFPEDGTGLVDNDLMMVLSGGHNPVAAHYFLNYLLDEEVAQTNFGFTGYQPPQNAIKPRLLVDDGYLPENLRTAAVLPEYFDTGARLLELPITVDGRWHEIWQEFKAGA